VNILNRRKEAPWTMWTLSGESRQHHLDSTGARKLSHCVDFTGITRPESHSATISRPSWGSNLSTNPIWTLPEWMVDFTGHNIHANQ